MSKIGPFMVGDTKIELVPHYIPGVGAQLFLIMHQDEKEIVKNITAADARLLANHLTIGACEADSLGRRANRKPSEKKIA